jgi:hypothetical protein
MLHKRNKKRPRYCGFDLTATEYGAIRTLALAHGLTIAEAVRRVLFGRIAPMNPPDGSSLADVKPASGREAGE